MLFRDKIGVLIPREVASEKLKRALVRGRLGTGEDPVKYSPFTDIAHSKGAAKAALEERLKALKGQRKPKLP